MKNTTIIFTLVSILIFTSCINFYKADGPIETQTYDNSDFKGVELDGAGDVFIYAGDVFEVEVTTHSDLFSKLNIYVSNGILHLGFKNEYHSIDFDKLQYKITLPELHYASIDGSGEINVMDNFTMDNDFAMSIDGSGDIMAMKITADRIFADIDGSGDITTTDIDCGIFTAKLNGSGTIRTQGFARKQNVNLNGSGDVITDYLETIESYVDIDGSGNCKVWATEYLSVRIDGSGNVYYYGNPELRKTINGSGTLRHLND